MILCVNVTIIFVGIGGFMVLRGTKHRYVTFNTNDNVEPSFAIYQLLGNEPCIDPMDRVKNDYFETITIVDPLELPEQVQSGIGMTTMIIPVHVENHFLQDFNQQAVSY